MQKDTLEQRGKEYTKLFMKFTKLWTGYFDKQVEEYIAYADNNPQMFVEMRKDIGDSFEEENIQELIDIYTLGMTIQDAIVQSEITIGLSIDIRNEDAIAWAKKRAGELIKGVNETTQKEIQVIIDSALTGGKSMKDIKDEITSKFIEYSEYRASLISIMETGTAFEQGKKSQFARYQDKFGMVGYKRSRTQDDSNVRPTHKENADA